MWAVLVDYLFFDHPRSIFLIFTHILILKLTILVDGAMLEEGWFERPLVPRKIADRRSHSILSFDPSTPQKKRRFPSPGFEPTTVLIHDLSWRLRPLTHRGSTVLRKKFALRIAVDRIICKSLNFSKIWFYDELNILLKKWEIFEIELLIIPIKSTLKYTSKMSKPQKIQYK